MSATVSTVIMSHPRRAEFVPELLAKLDRSAEVVWDDGDNSRWSTGRRSWLAVDRDRTHGLVLQDDAVIPHDLVAGVEAALEYVPDGSPVSLYAGRVRPFRDLVQQLVDRASDDTSWLAMSQLHWGVGIVMPTKWIDDMLTWCEQRSDVANYDKRISRWCQLQGLTVYYPWPSLVDHRISPSLVPGRQAGGRHAHRFLGADRSALDCEWTGGVVSIPELAGASARPPHHHTPAAVPASRPRTPTLGVAVKFVSTRYPWLQVPAARMRFRDGEAETSNPDAIAVLTSPQLRAMGVELAEDTAPAEPAPHVEAAGATPADAETSQPETPVPGPDAGGVPTGGAKEVLAWVNEDPETVAERAARALRVEQARDKPRTTLAATLTKLAG